MPLGGDLRHCLTSPAPLSPQPARHGLRLVPQPAQVHQVPHLHPVQVAHHQDRAGAAGAAHARPLPLQPPGLHGQEDPRGLRLCHFPRPSPALPPSPFLQPGLSALPGESEELHVHPPHLGPGLPPACQAAIGTARQLSAQPCPSDPAWEEVGTWSRSLLPHLLRKPPQTVPWSF